MKLKRSPVLSFIFFQRPYDNRIFSKDWNAIQNPVIDYFTYYDVVKQIYGKIYFTDSTKVPVFETSSNAASAAFLHEQLLYYSWYLEWLLIMKLPFLVYANE